MERVVLIGNCQIEAMTNLYKRFAEKSFGQTLTYIRSYAEITADERRAIENADFLVEQVQDFLPKADVAGIGSKGRRIGVPVVSCSFLWPFAGQAHPNNPHPPNLDVGPYGAEISDSYLNRLIKRGINPDAAVEEYTNLDINALVNLDRLYELTIEKQAARDELTGFRIAELIRAHFRDEALFLTPYQPNVRLAIALATQFFQKMGVDAADISRMQHATQMTLILKEELPVHPAVARHFGLKWAAEDRQYRFLAEGGFTFRQFARRYMMCEWNEELQEGLELSRSGQLEQAVEKLRTALVVSPQSAEGYGALASVLSRMGRDYEAHAVIVQAVVRNLNHPAYRLQLGRLAQINGDIVGAERELRVASALAPYDPHYPSTLAHFLNQLGRHIEAVAVARHGLVNAPYAASLHMELAFALDSGDDPEGAEYAFLRAANLAPDDTKPLVALAASQERRGHVVQAIETLKIALPLEQPAGGVRERLVTLLRRLDRSDEAAQQLRRQHDVAILAALPMLDPDHHPAAVDIADLEADRLRCP